MTHNEATQLLDLCGFETSDKDLVQIFCDFAELVAEAEREACAAIAFNAKTYIQAANEIRARGNT